MQRLHQQGRDHIWAYYTRNMVRPVALSRSKVDVVIGNPPWINYNQTADILRNELQNLSRDRYGIWAGGRYATHQDVAGLFFARSVDLYLKDGGVIGFVLPHSALQAGQYAKWRSGKWESPPRGRGRSRAPDFSVSVDFSHKRPWDLEPLEPNSFFPMASCVAFARSMGRSGLATPLPGEAERWTGKPGENANRISRAALTDTSATGDFPYGGYSRQGAVIVPPLPFLRQRNGKHCRRAGNANCNRQSPPGRAGQSALERPGPDFHHRADRRGKPPVQHPPRRDGRSLRHAGTPESPAPH